MAKHPIQPIEVVDGVTRFKMNAIVHFLLDAGPYDLNMLARRSFPRDDREQFTQLIGYSLSGASELDHMTDETLDAARRMHEEGETEQDARMDDPPDRCATCRFWKSRKDKNHPEWGECRKRPPRVIQGEDNSGGFTEWPLPTADEWCGEHEVGEYTLGHDREFGRRRTEDLDARRMERELQFARARIRLLSRIVAVSPRQDEIREEISMMNQEEEQYREHPANPEHMAKRIDMLSDALRWIVNVCCDVGKSGGKPEDGEHDAALQAGMNALKVEDSRGRKP